MNFKLIWKKFWSAMSFFDYAKCTVCEYDGVADPYCKPPLGQCCFTRKESNASETNN
jgi:hypothetical protein